ncbi:MAG: hypothetical protein C5B57_05815 [Blastocatellia bacterium]|nr:MAG: hypothetical protein C5B57_05815 [Blastocatellia bacterium]
MRLAILLAGMALAAGLTSATAQERTTHFAGPHGRRDLNAYQPRGRSGLERTEQFSNKYKLGSDGRFSLSNVDGNVVITGGAGDEATIEAVKRTRGDQRELDRVTVDVSARNGRVDVRTIYPPYRNNQVSVDYTVMVPANASVDIKSVSGNVSVRDVKGSVRAESVSGNVLASGTPRLELAKSVSGDVDLSDAGMDADVAASSISGNVRGKGIRGRSFEADTISGDVTLTDAVCDRLGVRSISGSVAYSGALARTGRYDFNLHSGNVRLVLSDSTGFDLTANTFSGSINSELPLTIGGDRARRGRQGIPNRRSVVATYGDGSAALTIKTFSGDIIIVRR